VTERARKRAWWRYGLAIWCWDRGEPQYLAHVVSANYVCPLQLAPVVGDIIGGRRKVNRRAAAKFRAGGVKAARAAALLYVMKDRERELCAKAAKGESAADDVRDSKGKVLPPIKVRRASEARVRDFTHRLANETGVSFDVLKDTEQSLRRFVDSLTAS